jgi:hypothetical protein
MVTAAARTTPENMMGVDGGNTATVCKRICNPVSAIYREKAGSEANAPILVADVRLAEIFNANVPGR